MTVASVALLIGCASTAPGPAAPGHTPQDDASDEAGLWYQMARFESQLAHSPARVQDAQLEGYLRELSCKVADRYCDDLRVYLDATEKTLLESPEYHG